MKSMVKGKNLFLIFLGIFLVLISISSRPLNLTTKNYSNEVKIEVLKTSLISGRIHIDNNWSDAKITGLCTGSGNSSDPYVIEDLVIDGGGVGSCILIENSEDYFKIENCTISNCGSDFYDSGIKLISANNGNLTNNRALDLDSFGLVMYESNNTFVVNNIFKGKHGISVRFSKNNVIYFNDFIGSLITIETRGCTNNRWSSQTKIEYIYSSNTYTNYLGNYYNGYNGFDNDNDGIGDTPQILDQHLPSSEWIYLDYYPLIVRIQNYELSVETQPPDAFVLSSNAGTPDTDGNFTLTWTIADRASNYSVYQHSGIITEINGSLTLLLNETLDLSLSLTDYPIGTYYFIVVARNNYGQSISNCVKIDIESPNEGGPTVFGYNLFILIGIICLFSIFLTKKLKISLR